MCEREHLFNILQGSFRVTKVPQRQDFEDTATNSRIVTKKVDVRRTLVGLIMGFMNEP